MAITKPTETSRPTTWDQVAFTLYRDIHKGIRSELFAVTNAAGAVDPADAVGRADLARHIETTMDFLVQHAEHEDGAIDPTLAEHLPDGGAVFPRNSHQKSKRCVEPAEDVLKGVCTFRSHTDPLLGLGDEDV